MSWCRSATPTRSVPDLDSVPVRVGHGEHAPLLIGPFHGDTLDGEGGGDGGGIVGVDAEVDIAWTVTRPELNSAVTEPQGVGTVTIRTTTEELVEGMRRFGIGHVESHIGEHEKDDSRGP